MRRLTLLASVVLLVGAAALLLAGHTISAGALILLGVAVAVLAEKRGVS